MKRSTAGQLAQQWHEDQPRESHYVEGGYSSCWCCCTACDPDWAVSTEHNPYFLLALASMGSRE